MLINLLFRYQIIDPGPSLRIESSWFHFVRRVSILTENGQSHLEDAVPSSRPAIAELAPLSALRTEYENGSGTFIKQIDFNIAALIFAYIERIFFQEDRNVAVESSIATLEGFLPKLRDVGFTDMVIDESYEIPRDLIRGIVDPQPVSTTGTTLTRAQLLKEFQDECSTWFNVLLLSQSKRSITMTDANPQRPIIWSRSCVWSLARRFRASQKRMNPS